MKLSLKGRALRLLSQREHSRVELARKLARHAESPEQLDKVLDELTAAKLLSSERFADSLVYRRAERFGTALIRQELRQHRLDDAVVAPRLAALKASEFDRARAVWLKRYGMPPADAAERARQMRFLGARGFSAEVVRRVVGGDFDADV
ncbi:MAG: recombination regulator RecX [Burkholderiales bacterium]|nr:recombination regulator RecX [Burkholderiales bacterium]